MLLRTFFFFCALLLSHSMSHGENCVVGDCHGAIGEIVQRAKVRHAPLYRPEGCLLCHFTHEDGAPTMLRAPLRELCLSCHGRDDFSTSKPLRNIARELQGKEILHGPVADGDCSACHQAHGSDDYRLLNARYPATFYAPYVPGTYEFCFQCHDAELLRQANSGSATQFRDGTRNLHVLHVADARKGRSCRACHAPHAGGRHLLAVAAGAAFGDWQIPLQVQLSADGGKCFTGCHRPAAYSRGLPPNSPPAKRTE